MSQNWPMFFCFANLTDLTLCQDEDIKNKCGILLQCTCGVGSCLQYSLVVTVHLIFLFSIIIKKFWNWSKAYQHSLPPEFISARNNGLTLGSLYKAALCSGILLCLSHFIVAIWGAIYSWENGWSQFLFLESAEVVQVIAWYSITAATARARTERRQYFPGILRAWWIASFFTASLNFFSNLLLMRRHVRVQLDAWEGILAFPICIFLCIVAINGRTGLSKPIPDFILEPLLDKTLHKTTTSGKVSHYATAGLISLATFSWLDPLLSVGYRKPLELDDIPQLAHADCAKEIFGIISMNREKCAEKSLLHCLVRTFWKPAAVVGCFATLSSCAQYVAPYLINNFVEYLGGRRQAKEGYILVGIFLGAKFIETFVQRQWFFGTQQLSLRLTAALTGLIYRKGLSLSNQSRQSHTSGEIINYMSVDVQRISDFSWFLHELWLLPIQLCLALTILYKNVGMATFAALGATAFTMLGNIPLSKVMDKFQDKIMLAKDERMKATSEVLRSMKVLKLQAWEMRYLKKLEDLRKVEYGWLAKFLYTQSVVVALFWSTPTLIAVITFSTCVLMGIPLTAGRVLSALATFRVLQEPIFNLPDLISMLSQTRVSLDRITKFLQEQELQVDAIDRSHSNMGNIAIEIKGASFSWDATHGATLIVSELQIKRGLKVAVCGMVGSGKSSLISCILGEIPRLSGSVKVSGSRAYVSQSPWIQSGKIQDNILFGKPFDSVKYEDVLKACALTKDLELFSHGDQTEIGERGINLSGGQKQRIQLARAIYHDADIYLLDDPFSAVDAHTGTHLFKECLLGVLGIKTVVYVTHQIEFLPAADIILVLQDGKIVQAGKFNDILQAGSNFGALIGAHNKAMDTVKGVESSFDSNENTEMMDKAMEDARANVQSRYVQQDNDPGTQDQKALTQIVQEEERETGQVSMAVYCSLARGAFGGSLVPVILLAQMLFQSLQIASNYWLAWATPLTYDGHPTVSNFHLLLVYIGLGTGSALCVMIRSLFVSTMALVTAQKFFSNMLRCIFRAPMSFFDSTPTGRILNRASTDQSALDLEVTQRFTGLAFNIIQLIGIVVVMSQVAWQVFALFVLVLGICVWLQRYYIASARELARLVGICKAPIIHHFGESLSGASTIRGFDEQSRFMNVNLLLIDCYSRPLFNNFASMEWLCLRLDLLTNCVFTFSLLLVVTLPTDAINASLAGLAVTYGLNLSMLQVMVVWNLCNLENKIISVERIQQYTSIPSEASLIIDNSRPPIGWPFQGTISLQNLQVRYALHMPLVLHGITCTFDGGKKIGVVGRTGSGKSTLTQALFRIVEPTAGKILIDGLDISRIGLHDLRSKLSIIPQDPTMFEGSLRSNLDPLEEYTDSEIWQAIDKSQLGDVVQSKDQKLDTSVTENGDNWSVGQRQLVCLGRALLKHTKILVLDEATASVDSATDSVIQDVIRTEFANCTVVTIAHRIPTVIDCDSVLFLKDGRVAEYNSPPKLLEDRSSLFAKLVAEYTTRSTTVC